MKKRKQTTKTEFVRFRLDKVEKNRLEKLCNITRRLKSDIIRMLLYDLYKQKYPECLED
jgi:hypothetical protein